MTGRRCWFCGEVKSSLTNEHVLSENNFGATLVAPKAICASCNSASGEVELLVAGGAWVSEAVVEFRTGSATRPRAYPQVQGRTSDGATVHVQEHSGGKDVIALVPRQIATDGDGTPVIEVESGTEKEYEMRQLKDGKRVRAVGRELTSLRVVETQRGIGLKTADAWGRFVAKVLLAAGSLALPDAWLDSPECAEMQGYFLRSRDKVHMPFYAYEQDRSAEPWSLLDGTHLISFHRSAAGQGTRFLLALFGYLGAEIELPETECPTDEPSWLVPCDFRPPVPVGWGQLESAIRDDAAQRLKP